MFAAAFSSIAGKILLVFYLSLFRLFSSAFIFIYFLYIWLFKDVINITNCLTI